MINTKASTRIMPAPVHEPKEAKKQHFDSGYLRISKGYPARLKDNIYLKHPFVYFFTHFVYFSIFVLLPDLTWKWLKKCFFFLSCSVQNDLTYKH